MIMEWSEHSITTTHKLIGVLIVNIGGVEYHVANIIKLLTHSNAMNDALLRNAISYTILSGVYYDIPGKANFSILQAYTLDNYCVGLDITTTSLVQVNEGLEQIVSIIKNLSYGIINNREYILSQEADHEANKICVVSSLDLINRRTIEFKFYLKKGSSINGH